MTTCADNHLFGTWRLGQRYVQQREAGADGAEPARLLCQLSRPSSVGMA